MALPAEEANFEFRQAFPLHSPATRANPRGRDNALDDGGPLFTKHPIGASPPQRLSGPVQAAEKILGGSGKVQDHAKQQNEIINEALMNISKAVQAEENIEDTQAALMLEEEEHGMIGAAT